MEDYTENYNNAKKILQSLQDIKQDYQTYKTDLTDHKDFLKQTYNAPHMSSFGAKKQEIDGRLKIIDTSLKEYEIIVKKYESQQKLNELQTMNEEQIEYERKKIKEAHIEYHNDIIKTNRESISKLELEMRGKLELLYTADLDKGRLEEPKSDLNDNLKERLKNLNFDVNELKMQVKSQLENPDVHLLFKINSVLNLYKYGSDKYNKVEKIREEFRTEETKYEEIIRKSEIAIHSVQNNIGSTINDIATQERDKTIKQLNDDIKKGTELEQKYTQMEKFIKEERTKLTELKNNGYDIYFDNGNKMEDIPFATHILNRMKFELDNVEKRKEGEIPTDNELKRFFEFGARLRKLNDKSKVLENKEVKDLQGKVDKKFAALHNFQDKENIASQSKVEVKNKEETEKKENKEQENTVVENKEKETRIKENKEENKEENIVENIVENKEENIVENTVKNTVKNKENNKENIAKENKVKTKEENKENKENKEENIAKENKVKTKEQENTSENKEQKNTSENKLENEVEEVIKKAKVVQKNQEPNPFIKQDQVLNKSGEQTHRNNFMKIKYQNFSANTVKNKEQENIAKENKVENKEQKNTVKNTVKNKENNKENNKEKKPKFLARVLKTKEQDFDIKAMKNYFKDVQKERDQYKKRITQKIQEISKDPDKESINTKNLIESKKSNIELTIKRTDDSKFNSGKINESGEFDKKSGRGR